MPTARLPTVHASYWTSLNMFGAGTAGPVGTPCWQNDWKTDMNDNIAFPHLCWWGVIWRQNERNDIRIFVNQQQVTMMSSLNFYTWGKVRAILWLHNNKAATSKIYIQQKLIALIYINFNILWYLLYLHTSSLEIKVKMCKRYTVHLIYLNLSVLHCWILLRITWIELRQQNTYTDFDFEFLRCFLDISLEMKYWISVEYWRCFLNTAPIFVFVGK